MEKITKSSLCAHPTRYLILDFFLFSNGVDQMEQWQEEENKQCIVTGFKILFGE